MRSQIACVSSVAGSSVTGSRISFHPQIQTHPVHGAHQRVLIAQA